MAIIYETNPGQLIPQGNRTVSTFPSGLVRVDQSFIGRTDLNATHRSQLVVGADFPGDQQPSYDGLRIFPEVQEKRLPDGFTEYLVSAYGRTTTDAIVNTSELVTYNPRTGISQKSKQITQKFVFASGESNVKPIEIDSLIEEIVISNPEAELTNNAILTTPYVWYSLKISFVGDGYVEFYHGDQKNTIYGTSNSFRTSSFFQKSNAESPWTYKIFGNISDLKVERYKDLSYSKITKSGWASNGADIINYGHFNEVTAKFTSVPSYFIT